MAEMAIDDRWGPSHSCGLERSAAGRGQAISYDLCRNQLQLTTGNVVALTMSCRVVQAMSTGVNVPGWTGCRYCIAPICVVA